MAFLRQTWTLTAKNLKVFLLRRGFATFFHAFLLPIVIAAFLSFVRNLFTPPAYFGIAEPRPIRSLADGLAASTGSGRNTVAFVNNGLVGGDIDSVIDSLADTVTAAGKIVVRLSAPFELAATCKSSLRGVTGCYGAVVFYSSPTEGDYGIWNYTIRADGSLGNRMDSRSGNNDVQIYALPLQRAIDAAIVNISGTDDARTAFATTPDEYLFTSDTEQEREEFVRQQYQAQLTNALGVAFIIIMIGICYHMTGEMATEREIGMSQLIDAMVPTRYLWQPQVIRFLSHHIAFTIVYLPGWVISALIVARGVFAHSSVVILLILFILTGLSFASMSILGASFFHKSQLSGVVSILAYLLLGILAQALTAPGTAVVAILSLLFAPCNFVWQITNIARFEQALQPTDLTQVAPGSPWQLPGIVLWVFLIIQIFGYAILGSFVERWLHSTATKGRNILRNPAEPPLEAIRIEGLTKVYAPGLVRRMFSFIAKPKEPVVAVNNLSLAAGRGQILALLGANGSGKSTTLDSIAGITKLSSGSITIDGTGGIGIAPQKNVMWDQLTVEEHIKIFNRLKSPNNPASKQEIRDLVDSIDLGQKRKALSKTLSGGQKRKLQLGMMLTGGSAVCCVDEVSSGIDPLSRRKIWDILLAERGKRTIILTTHFLDEADLLADHIAILSKGTLRASGTSVELKDKSGAGYRVHVFNARDVKNAPNVEGVDRKISFDVISYLAPSSQLAAQVIRQLEAGGITDYKFSGPTIEDTFLQVAEEVRDEVAAGKIQSAAVSGIASKERGTTPEDSDSPEKADLELLAGQPIGFAKQTWILILKRCVVFKKNWFPYVAAFLIPVIAAALTQLYVRDSTPVSCQPPPKNTATSTAFQDLYNNLFMVGGPSSQFGDAELRDLFGPTFSSNPLVSNLAVQAFTKSLHLVDSLPDFNQYIEVNRKNITPAGWWTGGQSTTPTLSYYGNFGSVFTGVFGLNALDMMMANMTIHTTYARFDSQWVSSVQNALQLLVYFGLAATAFPGFFALYPNIERRRNVRGLQYSNGVRSFPLWLAHTIFDFGLILVSAALTIGIFAGASSVWFHVGYLFIVFMLYGLATILLGYVISLYCRTQLATYAISAGSQAVGFLIYLIAYLSIMIFAPPPAVDRGILIAHFVLSAVFPVGSLVRALFVTLNLFSSSCSGEAYTDNPSGMLYFGGPILFLVVQSVLLFLFLLWNDSGASRMLGRYVGRRAQTTAIEGEEQDEEIAKEVDRIDSSTTTTGATGEQHSDGLEVKHLTKSFGKNTAVDNVTFGIRHGEVFALLGPNGAGKSTTISLIRGDIQPSRGGGDVLLEKTSITRRRAAARSHLGVCPQFDAIDNMTVVEHLRFYARIRGVPDVEHNVKAVLAAVGLNAFSTRMAAALSGGNKRKLSLGIALMGNPSVVLLDEPSSGLDAAAKRIMWRTLGAIVPGRCILLTTHSMEEADALATRAGILAKRMLALGTVDNLRTRFGDALHVHLVSSTAPHSTDAEMERMRQWVLRQWPGVVDVESKTYHGQMRFSIPASAVPAPTTSAATTAPANATSAGVNEKPAAARADGSAIGRLVVLLEENKKALGIEHYSVTPTTLDQVFLTIVGRHNVLEEGYKKEGDKKKSGGFWRRK
ncbi:ATP-binding cassette subfamily A (ABC1) member 3 [Microdochium nivale]|nr:ATP-binding cassette subfamily A (ABC1) member 3 [Microdochium nivale]